MRSFRVGLNKGVAVLLLATAGFQFFTLTVTGKQMYLLLGCLMALVGFLYLTGPAFQIEVLEGGSGEVLLKNPLGMTLRRHPFRSVADLHLDGRKLWITRTDGERKKVGGLAVHGSDMVRLAAWLDEARAAGAARRA